MKGRKGIYIHSKLELFNEQLKKAANKDKTVKKNSNYILTKKDSKYMLYKGNYKDRGMSKEIDKELIEDLIEMSAKDFEKFCINYLAVSS